ncbi:MAG: hypothetical protein CM15mP12_8610 [Gammaproteobacteria bacterium]|nr:MAG: hypothetical protein CM15mP12_8610 [Gammaproteobacteria bacterium]
MRDNEVDLLIVGDEMPGDEFNPLPQTLLEFMKREGLEFWIVFKILSFQREVLFL